MNRRVLASYACCRPSHQAIPRTSFGETEVVAESWMWLVSQICLLALMVSFLHPVDHFVVTLYRFSGSRKILHFAKNVVSSMWTFRS